VRRGIKLVMSAATVAVVGAGLRISAHHQATPVVIHALPNNNRPSPGPAKPTTPRPHSREAPAGPRPTRSTHVSLTVAGSVVDTAYGPVQVEVTLRDGRITGARALARPSGNGQTQQINSYAIPQLDQETITAQSAQIDTVSGASYTSDGYRQSLQSALDAAHRAGAR
jgi:uncharacterized protein with FMN-binding domain